jgi:hypothetical protein
VLVKTSGGYGGRAGQPGRSWLLIKHRDDWAGPIDITTFAPHSVKTPDADLADILAADDPDVWHSHAPAKGGDTGEMFKRIIQRALEIKQGNTPAQPKENTTAAKATKKKTVKNGAKKQAAKKQRR